jgi:hypothetical protein
VKDTKAPTVNVTKTSVSLKNGAKNAAQWLKTAKMANGTDRKSSATVYIKAPGAKKYTAYTYSNAKKYVFKKAGTYSVYYVVTNKNKTSVKTESKKVTVKVSTPATTTAKPATTEEPATTAKPATTEKPETTATTELQNIEKESANTASEASTAQ